MPCNRMAARGRVYSIPAKSRGITGNLARKCGLLPLNAALSGRAIRGNIPRSLIVNEVTGQFRSIGGSRPAPRKDCMALDIALNGTPAGIEDRLAVRCRSGDLTAFDELVARYQLRLFRFSYRLLR